MAHDESSALDAPLESSFVALKIVKAASEFRRAAREEIEVLTRLRETVGGTPNIAMMVTSFEHEGPNGMHDVIVLQLCGPDLLALIRSRNFAGLPAVVVKVIARHILKGLVELHDVAGLTHTDLKPENVLLSTPSEHVMKSVARYRASIGAQSVFDVGICSKILHCDKALIISSEVQSAYCVRLADMGCARKLPAAPSPDESQRRAPILQTREYRSPEVLLGYRAEDLSSAVDIWSFGCLVYELMTGRFLFDPKDYKKTVAPFDIDSFHLSLLQQLLGKHPIADAGKRHPCSSFFSAHSGSALSVHRLQVAPPDNRRSPSAGHCRHV